MSNPFDQLGEISPFDDDLSGLGSKLKKALKKVEKGVKKIIPKPIEKVRKKISAEIRRSPIAQGVLATVASVVATPAAGAAIKAGFAAKAYSTARKKAKRDKVVEDPVYPAEIPEMMPYGRPGSFAPVKSDARGGRKPPTRKPYERPTARTVTEDTLQYKDRIRRKNPKFEDMANTMRSNGASEQQIVDTWTQSSAFVDTAKDAVREKGFDQQLITDLINRGMPAPVAQSYAPQVIERLTNDAVSTARTETNPLMVGGAIAAGAGLLYVLMAPKKRTQ